MNEGEVKSPDQMVRVVPARLSSGSMGAKRRVERDARARAAERMLKG